MSAEENRRLVNHFMHVLKTRNYDNLLPLASPGATWWVAGPPDKVPISGTHLLTDRIAQMKAAFSGAGSVSHDIRSMTAEGNRVVVEYVTKVVGPTEGQVYETPVLCKFEIESGKVKAVRVYQDTTAFVRFAAAGAAPPVRK